jgi:hypothetical protein
MFARPDLNTSIGDLQTLVASREDAGTDHRVEVDKIEFHLDATDPTISLGDVEVPASPEALGYFGDMLQFPQAALKRFGDSVSKETMNSLLNELTHNTLKTDAKVTVHKKSGLLLGVDEWSTRKAIRPHNLVQAIGNVLGDKSPVVRLIDTPQFFGFDAHVDLKSKNGIGGDGTKTTDIFGNEVDDITAGGIRVGVNLKQGLAPTVEEVLHRLACTNGMTLEDTALKVDARGNTVEEVMEELEELARIAFGRVEKSIEHFYDMKSQKVANVERTIRTIARERGIPDRSTIALIDLAASDDMPDDPSMFDVVNLVTNFANSPSFANRDGGRLILEGAGGSTISDHASRCGHCTQKIR